jgi:hypothetical protein
MAYTSNDVANQAVQLMGDNQPPVSGQAPAFDTSTAGVALSKLYAPCVRTVAKQFGWDFARSTVTLNLSGNPPPPDFAYEYVYPSGVEIWQLLPSTIPDANNPIPVDWVVANNVYNGAQVRVIWSNLPSAVARFNNAPIESAWDDLFREAVVRLLASELATALSSKPDTAQTYLQSGGAFETLGEGRNG